MIGYPEVLGTDGRFIYEVRANNTQTVDITKLSPDNVDFHIEVE